MLMLRLGRSFGFRGVSGAAEIGFMGGGLSRLMRMCGRSIGLEFGGWGSVKIGAWCASDAALALVLRLSAICMCSGSAFGAVMIRIGCDCEVWLPCLTEVSKPAKSRTRVLFLAGRLFGFSLGVWFARRRGG
jgi:hypothetical protein